jgi:hypothetical protein
VLLLSSSHQCTSLRTSISEADLTISNSDNGEDSSSLEEEDAIRTTIATPGKQSVARLELGAAAAVPPILLFEEDVSSEMIRVSGATDLCHDSPMAFYSRPRVNGVWFTSQTDVTNTTTATVTTPTNIPRTTSNKSHVDERPFTVGSIGNTRQNNRWWDSFRRKSKSKAEKLRAVGKGRSLNLSGAPRTSDGDNAACKCAEQYRSRSNSTEMRIMDEATRDIVLKGRCLANIC